MDILDHKTQPAYSLAVMHASETFRANQKKRPFSDAKTGAGFNLESLPDKSVLFHVHDPSCLYFLTYPQQRACTCTYCSDVA